MTKLEFLIHKLESIHRELNILEQDIKIYGPETAAASVKPIVIEDLAKCRVRIDNETGRLGSWKEYTPQDML